MSIHFESFHEDQCSVLHCHSLVLQPRPSSQDARRQVKASERVPRNIKARDALFICLPFLEFS